MELPDDADTQKIDTEYCIWPRSHPEADIAATESAAYGPQFRFIRGRRPLHPSVDTSLAGTLTDREHEVLVLMARGLDNIQIGAEPFGSEATVRTHVGQLYPNSKRAPECRPGGRPRVRSCAAKVCFRAVQQWVWWSTNVQWRWHRGLSTSHVSSSSKWRRSSPVVADTGLGSP